MTIGPASFISHYEAQPLAKAAAEKRAGNPRVRTKSLRAVGRPASQRFFMRFSGYVWQPMDTVSEIFCNFR